MQVALPTPRSGRSPLFDIPPSLFIPHVPRRVSLFDILSQVGEIDSVDWIDGRTYVHFTVWYDTPVAEELYSVISEGRSYRLYDSGKYVICRQNRHPVPRYRGPYSRDYLMSAIHSLAMADGFILKPKHVRFETGKPIVVEYYVPASQLIHTENVNMKNIHQLAAEYEWWIQTSLQNRDVDSIFNIT